MDMRRDAAVIVKRSARGTRCFRCTQPATRRVLFRGSRFEGCEQHALDHWRDVFAFILQHMIGGKRAS